MSDDQYKIDAVGSILRDKVRTFIPLVPEANMPFNALGDYKNNVQYNYTGLTNKNSPDNVSTTGVFIDNVYTSKIGGITYTQKTNINPDVFSMIIDLEISDIRTPRS